MIDRPRDIVSATMIWGHDWYLIVSMPADNDKKGRGSYYLALS